MTDEEILATAEATGLKLITLGLDKQKSEFLILAFAKQIAKLERYHEREACAKLADEYATYGGSKFYDWFKKLAIHIRNRGEA